jgi:hypothetical protein
LRLWHFNILGLSSSGDRFFGKGRLRFLALLLNVSEDVVKNEKTCGLSSKDKGLTEFFGLATLVGGFPNNLNDDVIEGALGVDVCDADFAVLEFEGGNALLNLLLLLDCIRNKWIRIPTVRPTATWVTSASTPETNWDFLL